MQRYKGPESDTAFRRAIRKTREFTAAFLVGSGIMLAASNVAFAKEGVTMAEKTIKKEVKVVVEEPKVAVIDAKQVADMKAREEMQKELSSIHKSHVSVLLTFYEDSDKKIGRLPAGEAYRMLIEMAGEYEYKQSEVKDALAAKGVTLESKRFPSTAVELKAELDKLKIKDDIKEELVDIAYRSAVKKSIDNANLTLSQPSIDYLKGIVDKLKLSGEYGIGGKYCIVDEKDYLDNVEDVGVKWLHKEKYKTQAVDNLNILVYVSLINNINKMDERPTDINFGASLTQLGQYRLGTDTLEELQSVLNELAENKFGADFADAKGLAPQIEKVGKAPATQKFSLTNVGLGLEALIPVSNKVTQGLDSDGSPIYKKNGKDYARASDALRLVQDEDRMRSVSMAWAAKGYGSIFSGVETDSNGNANWEDVLSAIARDPEGAKKKIDEYRRNNPDKASDLDTMDTVADAIIALRNEVPKAIPSLVYGTVSVVRDKTWKQFRVGVTGEFTTGYNITNEETFFRGSVGGTIGFTAKKFSMDFKAAVGMIGTTEELNSVFGEAWMTAQYNFKEGDVAGVKAYTAIHNKPQNLAKQSLGPTIAYFETEPFGILNIPKAGVSIEAGPTYSYTRYDMGQMYGPLFKGFEVDKHGVGENVAISIRANDITTIQITESFKQHFISGKLAGKELTGGLNIIIELPGDVDFGIGVFGSMGRDILGD